MAEVKVEPKPVQRKEWENRAEEGWWEYGVGGMKWSSGKPAEPMFYGSQLASEIAAERYEHLYVVRRWITPGTWQKLTEDQQDDHPGVDDWQWEQYLEWRAKQSRRLPDITAEN